MIRAWPDLTEAQRWRLYAMAVAGSMTPVRREWDVTIDIPGAPLIIGDRRQQPADAFVMIGDRRKQ